MTGSEIVRDTERKDFYPITDKNLGIKCCGNNTIFRLWAPTAKEVEVSLYPDENKRKIRETLALSQAKDGVWELKVSRYLAGNYYLYRLNFGDRITETVDPWAFAASTDSELGLIVDLERTNPEGWKEDSRINLQDPVDAVIYELHIRDFSMSPTSGIKNRGKYLAFQERGTRGSGGIKTGIDHLLEMGITHVHLLPFFDFASVSDSGEDYNWGYDPHLYNVPEGSYASDPSDTSRIRELKLLIKSLHEAGIGVIMDAVYNHTYYTERSPFQLTVPDYFYRFYQGEPANGSGCGNEIATEKPMVRKFILDSLRFWVEEYHLDGFRFDLMGLIDKETLKQAEEMLHQIEPSILIYGEPWSALPPQLDKEQQIYKGKQKRMNIAVFNDDFRNCIRGSNRGEGRGYISGKYQWSGGIKHGVVGSVKYDQNISGFTARPSETVNYVSAHDDLTLWDKINLTCKEEDEELKIRRDRLAQAIVFTSQGIPFFQGGEEFLRTKYGNHNSYNAGDEINQLKWERKASYYETFEYYRGLITLRREHPAFRLRSTAQIRHHLKFLDSPAGTVAFHLVDHAGDDSWQEILVLYNPHHNWSHFNGLTDQKWQIVVDDRRAGVESFNSFRADNVYVPPVSAMVLYH